MSLGPVDLERAGDADRHLHGADRVLDVPAHLFAGNGVAPDERLQQRRRELKRKRDEADFRKRQLVRVLEQRVAKPLVCGDAARDVEEDCARRHLETEFDAERRGEL